MNIRYTHGRLRYTTPDACTTECIAALLRYPSHAHPTHVLHHQGIGIGLMRVRKMEMHTNVADYTTSQHPCRPSLPDPDTLPPRHVDVAIVGGGPGGLATANALLRVDPSLHIEVHGWRHGTTSPPPASTRHTQIPLQVFERLPHRPMGSSILLNVNGQNAIEAIDPQIYYHLLERSVVLTRTSIFNATTGDLVEEHPDRQGEMLNKYGKAPRLLGWHEIRETLLEALPPDMVHFNQPVLSYQDLQATHVGGGIRVEFIEDIAPVEAKILIGADGWFSYTRFQNLHDPPPSFQNRVFWRARIPWRQGLPNDHTQWFVEGDRATSRFACIIPVSDTEVVWQASAPATDVKAAGLEVEVQAPPNPSAQANASFHADPKRVCVFWGVYLGGCVWVSVFGCVCVGCACVLCSRGGQ